MDNKKRLLDETRSLFFEFCGGFDNHRFVGKHSLPLSRSFDEPKMARCRSPFFNGSSILGLFREVLVDSRSSFTAFTHSEDYCCCSEDDVAAGPYFGVVGSLLFVYEDVAALVGVEAWSCAYEEWV